MINWKGDGRKRITPPAGAPGNPKPCSLASARRYVLEFLSQGHIHSHGTMLWVAEDFCAQHNIGFVTTPNSHGWRIALTNHKAVLLDLPVLLAAIGGDYSLP